MFERIIKKSDNICKFFHNNKWVEYDLCIVNKLEATEIINEGNFIFLGTGNTITCNGVRQGVSKNSLYFFKSKKS